MKLLARQLLADADQRRQVKDEQPEPHNPEIKAERPLSDKDADPDTDETPRQNRSQSQSQTQTQTQGERPFG